MDASELLYWKSENMGNINEKLYSVITTIFPPGPCVRELGKRLTPLSAPLVVIGDKKGPVNYELDGAVFIPLTEQETFGFKISSLLPTGHYARKNIGYLYAIMNGADCIYETDDDNAPNDLWHVRKKQVSASMIKHEGWINVYKYFTDKIIWPRGLPLDKIHDYVPHHQLSVAENVIAPIQQGLADSSPDVDAVWRLILGSNFTFSQKQDIYLEPGTWCPFNSQNTWWWPEAFTLMYLPSHCTFRMTDIWRGFVSQLCLWAMGYGISFHSPDVYQDRNPHNLMRDFEAEVPGYLGNASFADTLNNMPLITGLNSATSNLKMCYDALIEKGFFPKKEMALVEAWCCDVEEVMKIRTFENLKFKNIK